MEVHEESEANGGLAPHFGVQNHSPGSLAPEDGGYKAPLIARVHLRLGVWRWTITPHEVSSDTPVNTKARKVKRMMQKIQCRRTEGQTSLGEGTIMSHLAMHHIHDQDAVNCRAFLTVSRNLHLSNLCPELRSRPRQTFKSFRGLSD